MEENKNKESEQESVSKPVLAFYINVDGLDRSDVPVYLEDIRKNLDSDDLGGFTKFLIAVTNQETKVECVNPVLVTEESIINQFKNSMNKLNQYLSQKIEEENNHEETN